MLAINQNCSNRHNRPDNVGLQWCILPLFCYHDITTFLKLQKFYIAFCSYQYPFCQRVSASEKINFPSPWFSVCFCGFSNKLPKDQHRIFQDEVHNLLSFCVAQKTQQVPIAPSVWVFIQFHKGEIQCLSTSTPSNILRIRCPRQAPFHTLILKIYLTRGSPSSVFPQRYPMTITTFKE